MKGIVFTEFLEMVEERFSLEVVDGIIERAALPSGGSYTAVGTYPVEEMGRLVTELSAATGAPVPALLHAFGKHLMTRFTQGFPQFFADSTDALGLLERVENVIHVEVKKLYPDAELPSFECTREGPDRVVMVYRSPRRLSDLAAGLIEGCAEHYGEALDVTRDDLSGDGQIVRFTITRGTTA